MDNAIQKLTKAPFESVDQLLAAFSGGFSIAELERVGMTLTEYDDERKRTIHRFSPGLYIREMQMPAGIVVLGHKQITVHLNIFLKGRITMLNEDGTNVEMSAPIIFASNPGQKCCYVHEDMVWLNIYPTDETDIEKLEEMFLGKSEYSQEFLKDVDFRKHEIITDLTEEVN